MDKKTVTTAARKRVALVAHDNMKPELTTWAVQHKDKLIKHELMATGTTGNLISRATGMNVNAMLSGPMGGDQQVGALISEGKLMY